MICYTLYCICAYLNITARFIEGKCDALYQAVRCCTNSAPLILHSAFKSANGNSILLSIFNLITSRWMETLSLFDTDVSFRQADLYSACWAFIWSMVNIILIVKDKPFDKSRIFARIDPLYDKVRMKISLKLPQ